MFPVFVQVVDVYSMFWYYFILGYLLNLEVKKRFVTSSYNA